MVSECSYYTKCTQTKRTICMNSYEHCTIYSRFETLKTPEDKTPIHIAKLGIERFMEKYPDWLGVGAVVNLGGSAVVSTKA